MTDILEPEGHLVRDGIQALRQSAEDCACFALGTGHRHDHGPALHDGNP